MFQKLFPLGIATDTAFLGRSEECQHLVDNIEASAHTLLHAPRRYGKTSLVQHVLKQGQWSFEEIDLFLAADAAAIEQKILKGVRNLLDNITDSKEMLLSWLMDYFKTAKKQWSFSFKGLRLELMPPDQEDIPGNILDALNAVEFALAKANKRAVMFIDEFQEVAKLKHNIAFEGAIRHFAQSSNYLVFVFAGSNRHLMSEIFFDRARPFYELCDVIRLHRIPAAYYQKYLQKAARKTWKLPLDPSVETLILSLTERHPRRVYQFCRRLWTDFSQRKAPPTQRSVQDTWLRLVFNSREEMRALLAKRSVVQVKLLGLIANGVSQKLTGQTVLKTLNVSGSAVTQSLATLEADDLIDLHEAGSYQITDPILKATLLEYAEDD